MSYNVTSTRFQSFCVTNPSHETLPPFDDHNESPGSGRVPLTLAVNSNATDPNMAEDEGSRPTDHSSIPHLDSEKAATMCPANDTSQCCCGRPSCAYLDHNNTALGGLEKELETAARLGQALLHRHESYMASSEAERIRLNSTVASLETENSTLQAANDRIVAENRSLLDKLEGLNTTLAETDGHVKSLEATLASAQLELRRLAALARRTEDLEQQLVDIERDRVVIEEELGEKRDEGRTALRRWREAEGRVRTLEIEVGRIEREAKLERERHEEVLGRMTRRSAVERTLGSAEGRLKGAAAVAGLRGDPDIGPTSVVSHFVRDLLHDNANLQAGVVELRELLQTSNEEVQSLREQIMLHQPLDGMEVPGNDPQTPFKSLEQQLWDSQPHQMSPEVHVHHHYHAKFSARKERAPVSKRHSRKRSSIGQLGSTSESSTPSTPLVRPLRNVSSPLLPALSMKQPVPRSTSKRWSMQSAATVSTRSSLPSSPRSYFDRPSDSIFDRLDLEEEYSRPTSPESMADFSSPAAGFGPGHRKGKHSEMSLMAFRELDEDEEDEEDVEPTAMATEAAPPAEVAKTEDRAEEDGVLTLNTTELSRTSSEPTGTTDVQCAEPLPPEINSNTAELAGGSDADIEEIRPLRRSASHDSLVSISGMDIHIARRRPSQVFVIGRGLTSNSISKPSASRTISASQPLASIAEVTASSSKRSFNSDDTSASLAMLSGLAGVPGRASAVASQTQASGLGKLVGGWVRGRWGIAPVKSSGDLRAQAEANMFSGRPPGINQKGGIPGLRPPARTPSQIHAKVLDKGLLRESLAE